MKKNNDIYTNKDIKHIFENYDAFDKLHTVNKNTLFRELENLKDGKKNFNKLTFHQVIRKYNNRYYFSKECEKNKKKRITFIFFKLLPLFILIICSIIIFISQSSNFEQPDIPSNTANNTNIQAITHDIKDFNMQIIVPSSMSIATGNSLDYLLGDGASDFYEFAIYNNECSLTCFIQDTTIDMVDTYWNNVNKVYSSDSNYKIISNKKEETISDFNFTTFEAESSNYKELFFGLYNNNKFISFQYTYPASVSDGRLTLNNIIKKIN